MSFIKPFKSYSGTQPNFSFAFVGSPINSSTSVTPNQRGSADRISFPMTNFSNILLSSLF